MKISSSLCLILACFASTTSIIGVHGKGISFSGILKVIMSTLIQPIFSTTIPELHQADVFEFPHHVAIVTTDEATDKFNLVCQGAIVDYEWIITSAFCIWSNLKRLHFDKTFAKMGTVDYTVHNSMTSNLSFYVFHPLFNVTTGEGTDLAMMMLSEPILDIGLEKIIKLDKDFQKPIDMDIDCLYSCYIDDRLYGNSAKLIDDYNCQEIGIPDDIGHCVYMNDTIHIKNKKFERGCPFVCKKKLYALRNSDGHFTTVVNISSWVHSVIERGMQLNKNSEGNSRYRKLSKTPEVKDGLNPRILDEPVVREPRILKDKFEDINSDSLEYDDDHPWNRNMSRSIEIVSVETRSRRSIGTSSVNEPMFIAWARAIDKMSPRRQVDIKIAIARIVADGEIAEINEKQRRIMEQEHFKEIEKQRQEIQRELEESNHYSDSDSDLST